MPNRCNQIRPGTYSAFYAIPTCLLPSEHEGMHMAEISHMLDDWITVFEWDTTTGACIQSNRRKERHARSTQR